jgi:hypothetical protein
MPYAAAPSRKPQSHREQIAGRRLWHSIKCNAQVARCSRHPRREGQAGARTAATSFDGVFLLILSQPRICRSFQRHDSHSLKKSIAIDSAQGLSGMRRHRSFERDFPHIAEIAVHLVGAVRAMQ